MLLFSFEEDDADLGTADLVGIGQIVYHVALVDPLKAWNYGRRITELARRHELGRAGWDSVVAVLAGSVRRALRSKDSLSAVIEDMQQLPAPMQAEVVRCAREEDDERIFRALQNIHLADRANQIFGTWARDRARRLST
jgi:hypothetical protein